MVSICDIVLNHTANESPFLLTNPECTYNCANCPYLRPSYLLDAALFELTVQVAAGEWELKGIPSVVETEEHLNVSIIFVYFNFKFRYFKVLRIFFLLISEYSPRASYVLFAID